MNTGTGPGPITPDGSAVEFYAALPQARTRELVEPLIPAGLPYEALSGEAGPELFFPAPARDE
ncbi:hypothetical protein Misp01_57770 [Microtetraspora sp. NBRC 13810]|uniref:hypothetical protein n=1 Tax=Microtetraspora sp. NBRC 13810 TaxID=3030990 RepID=UPI0024A32F77|nr:hypothetical protein [Microtetraspora sp. NBRC 13810]GLW10649.1 hypothetical protein Misp01_57770 [Microtetraspora sp. NBRC 13810]